MTEHRFTNELHKETSPYLLQHQYNPVNWYAWGEKALQRAKQENKPIFLSIGYSTCHWCHKMAHDCFEDEDVAKLLNESFIAIKVDREERPDIDEIYMNVCQMLTGTGGWPLNVFLTPEQLPFYAGTYFPKYSVGNQAGMLDILPYLQRMFTEEREHIERIGQRIQQGLHLQNDVPKVELAENLTTATYDLLVAQFDKENGGFQGAPKFPQTAQLQYLMKYGFLKELREPFQLVEKTLDQIYRGGIYDHLGGGFARYSTDEKWLVPHFEKMLYDQAQLLIVYAEAYQYLKKPLYKHIIEETFTFLTRELRAENGLYYSAIDADSEGVEGAYYVWQGAELDAEFAALFGSANEPHLDGKYVLNLLANEQYETIGAATKDIRASYLAKREQREYPHRDTKHLSGWNALLVVGLAKAGAALQNIEIMQEAQHLLAKIETHCRAEELLYVTDAKQTPAFLADYSYLLWAYNELYELTVDEYYIAKAQKLAAQIERLFAHPKGGYATASSMHERLIVNQKNSMDNALPSGNSVLANELHRLARFTDDVEMAQQAIAQLAVFSSDLMRYPTACLALLQLQLTIEARGLDYHIASEKPQFIDILQQQYRPFTIWTYEYAPSASLQICHQTACLRALQGEQEILKKLLNIEGNDLIQGND